MSSAHFLGHIDRRVFQGEGLNGMRSSLSGGPQGHGTLCSVPTHLFTANFTRRSVKSSGTRTMPLCNTDGDLGISWGVCPYEEADRKPNIRRHKCAAL